MGLLNILRSVVKIADKATKDLQSVVQYQRAIIANDGYKTKTYTSPVPLHAIVDWKTKQLRTTSGELTVSRATITLLDIDEVVNATDGEGIGDDDVFILQDETTGPIIDLGGFIDAGTGHPIATDVFIG